MIKHISWKPQEIRTHFLINHNEWKTPILKITRDETISLLKIAKDKKHFLQQTWRNEPSLKTLIVTTPYHSGTHLKKLTRQFFTNSLNQNLLQN